MTPRQSMNDSGLVGALRDLARHEARVQAPPHVESRIMAAWDDVHVTRARASARRALGVAAALAAGILLAATFAALRGVNGEPIALPNGPQRLTASDAPPVAVDVTDTVPTTPQTVPVRQMGTVRQSTAISQTPDDAKPMTLVVVGEPLTAGEPVHVVRMRVDASRLAAFGVRPVTQADSVNVELLVGEDGVARGLRIGM